MSTTFLLLERCKRRIQGRQCVVDTLFLNERDDCLISGDAFKAIFTHMTSMLIPMRVFQIIRTVFLLRWLDSFLLACVLLICLLNCFGD